MSDVATCYACGEPTWVWHYRDDDCKEGSCAACGAAWFLMDGGELDVGIIEAEAKPRNDISFFMEEWVDITETGCDVYD